MAQENKHLVCFVPNRGTEWRGSFRIDNIFPGKEVNNPDLEIANGRPKIPEDWSVTLSPGDAVILNEKTYVYYTEKTTGLKVPTIEHEVIKSGNKLYKSEHGEVIKQHIVKTKMWTEPAHETNDPQLTPYTP